MQLSFQRLESHPILPNNPDMKFFSAISDDVTTDTAAGQMLDSIPARDDIDVAFFFFTRHHTDEIEAITKRIWKELDPQVLIGCSAESVIGGNREIEQQPGMSMLVGQSINAWLDGFYVAGDEWREMLQDAESLKDRMNLETDPKAIIGVGDPFTTPVTQFFQLLGQISPTLPVIGGMASAARQPGENVLVWNDMTYNDGFVGVTLGGAIEIDTVVSQGCRPIGKPMVITKSHNNMIEQLGGKPALQALQDTIVQMPAHERQLLERGLLIGRVISEYQDSFARGDFLVRNLMGADQKTGSIAVADFVKTGQTVQFHVRDAATAHEDLEQLLEVEKTKPAAAAALLFSCNGRGQGLFKAPDHDVRVTHGQLPDVPVAGFFAAGELGPVGGSNFIHGHTASFAMIRPKM